MTEKLNVAEELKRLGLSLPETHSKFEGNWQRSNIQSAYNDGVAACVETTIAPLLRYIETLELGINRMAEAARVAGLDR